MSQIHENAVMTLEAATTLVEFRRVRFSSGVTIGYAGAADTDCIGVLERPATAGDYVPVRVRSAQGTVKISTTEAVNAGAAVYAAASGQIATSGSVLVGVAMEAAAGANSVIEVMLSPAAILGAIARTALTQDDLKAYRVPLAEMRVTGTLALLGNSAGTPAGAFAITPGTHGSASPKLVGEAASGNAKTDYCRFPFVLPAEYTSGETVTLRVKARITGNVSTTQTIDAQVYESDGAAGISADLCATAAQVLTASFANYDFTITPTDLVAGDLLDIQLVGVADDTGGTANKLIEIGAVHVLCDVKG